MQDSEKTKQKALSELSKWSEGLPEEARCKLPIDLKAIGSYWGVTAIVERKQDVAGLLYRVDRKSSVIVLKEGDVPGRQRFSWAHELGHIVMADKALEQIACRQPGQKNQSLERSCDIIAAEILMPEILFSAEVDRCSWTLQSIRRLANTFQVTVQAAARRLLDLLKEPALISLWRPGDGQALQRIKYSWSIPNALGRPFRPQIKWQIGPDAMGPMYEACSHAAAVRGRSKVLMKTDRGTIYRWVETEALAVGRGVHGSVLGFHYLSRTIPELAGY